MVAEVKDALGAILAELRERGTKASPDARDALERARRTGEAWRGDQAGVVLDWAGETIHPAHAIGVIGEFFGEDAIYTVDGGLTSVWAYSILPPVKPRSYHSILELGMLGTGIPSAIGSRIGAPDREVVCITGDGAAGFNIMEMQSAAREQIKVTAIVFAEGSWTMEEPNELALYGRTFGTEQGEIRWDRIAEGLGCHGEYVDRIDHLGPALARTRETDRPAVICLRTDREANREIPRPMAARWKEIQAGPQPGA